MFATATSLVRVSLKVSDFQGGWASENVTKPTIMSREVRPTKVWEGSRAVVGHEHPRPGDPNYVEDVRFHRGTMRHISRPQDVHNNGCDRQKACLEVGCHVRIIEDWLT